MKQNTPYTAGQLLDLLESYIRMIERNGEEYPTVTLSDLKCSINSVLRANGRTK
jgi:hypothetical protein